MRNPGGPVPVVLALMKNTINVSNNVSLVLNTYKCLLFFFFFKLLMRTFDVVRQLRSTAWKWKGCGISNTRNS